MNYFPYFMHKRPKKVKYSSSNVDQHKSHQAFKTPLLFVLFNCQFRPHKYKDNCSQTRVSGPTPESVFDTLEVSACFEACGLKLLFFLAVTLSPAIFLTLKITPSLHSLKFLKQLSYFIL